MGKGSKGPGPHGTPAPSGGSGGPRGGGKTGGGSRGPKK